MFGSGAVGIAVASRSMRWSSGGSGGSNNSGPESGVKLLEVILKKIKDRKEIEINVNDEDEYDVMFVQDKLKDLGYEVSYRRSKRNNKILLVKKSTFLISVEKSKKSNKKIHVVLSVVIGFVLGYLVCKYS